MNRTIQNKKSLNAGPRHRQVQPLSQGVAKQLLMAASNRATLFLHGQTATELAAAFKEASENYDANAKEFNALCLKAQKGDADAAQELAAMQVWSIDNFIKVNAIWGAFFEQGTLAEGDNAWIQTSDHHELHIITGAQDGGRPRWQRERNRTKTLVPYYSLASEVLEYTLRDWYEGNIADRAKAGLDVAYDLGMQLDGKFQTIVAAGIGDFTLTGDKWTRVYVPHSRINTANLPTSNLLTPSGNGASTLFRKACFDVIINYCRSWGENTFGDGPLVPTAIYIPSSHYSGFLDQVSITDPDNEMNRQVFEFGVVMSYGGYQWTLIADPTLDPAAGRAYVRFNKPFGKHWSKPSEDVLIIDDSAVLRRENRETMEEQKVFATVAPAQRRVNIAAVQYRTAA